MKRANFPRLVGVIHLPALPGAPGCRAAASSSVAATARRAVQEARLLEDAGFEALIIENFGDAPFFKTAVPPLTVAAMTVVVQSVRAATRLPLGINVLRNDGHAALAIAAATGCQFIRVNVLSGVAATDQGIIEGDAARLLRERAALALTGTRVQIWGDAMVKHAQSLSVTDLALAIEEVTERALADAVIVTGTTTGRPIELQSLATAVKHRAGAPLFLGSGALVTNLAAFAPLIDGVIVGSALRAGGVAGQPLESARARKFAKAWHDLF